ncbi:glutamate--tRNA ligase [bacterium]|nr:glutamate--tRNA ligase [Planktomarina sp.]MBQ58190.1 glutamate--tRNA ligase [bacterium]|tara:strand:+ start:845 stop:2173 length:1329 start_codon:yes stop_codon:yes gene_type:complete
MTTTRFAPSPTGHLHVGNLRTALFNYLIARQMDGTFVLRIDDTDPVRSKPKYVDSIKRDLEWLGLYWDQIEFQSNRLEQYAQTAEKLRDMGKLYECFESSLELDLKRKKQLNMGKPPVYDRSSLTLSKKEKDSLRVESNGYWRFMLDQSRIDWADGILGETSIDVASVSDPVLIRGDGQVLYTLASICDDTDMGVSYVVRGSDHVTNTATQIQIIQALSGNVPKFAHHSLLVGSKGEGLSKRLGSLALGDMREAGLQPMALLSHLAKLGSSEPVELMGSLDEIILGFDLTKFGASPTKFDQMDLAPLTMKYLQGLSASDIIADISALGVPPEKAEDFWNIVRMNISTLKDLSAWWDLMEKGAEPKIDDQDREFVLKAVSLLPPGQFDANTWKTWTQNVTEVTGRSGKNLYMPLRQALTGMSHGPDMGHLLPFLKNIKIKNKP